MSTFPEIVLLDSDESDEGGDESPHPSKIQKTSDATNIYEQNGTRIHSSTSVVNGTPTSAMSKEPSLAPAPWESSASSSDQEDEEQQDARPASASQENPQLVELSSSSSEASDQGDSDLEELSYDDDKSDRAASADPDERENIIAKENTAAARLYLKTHGSMRFLDKYLPITASSEDLLNLIKLLGYKPTILHNATEEEKLMFLIKFLQRVMNKVLIMRGRIPEFNTIDHFVEKLKTSNKIMVLTGAGISTSLGIPDFRSSKGFYARLQHLGLEDPQEVFDLNYFREDPSIFYSIAHMIVPPEDAFTPLHGFIKLLQDKGKLLRNYTQNIDNLESNVGIDKDKLIQCHGSFATASCITCGFRVPGETIFAEIRSQEIPICPWCKQKRDKLDEELQGSYGVMKPDITFFGEALPERFHQTIKQDIADCDLLICIGTSLKVAPVSNIVNLVSADVPQILINKDLVRHCEFDLSLLGYCDQVISFVCSKLDWQIEHKDFEKILNNGLECTPIEPEIGVYEITDKDYRDRAPNVDESDGEEE